MQGATMEINIDNWPVMELHHCSLYVCMYLYIYVHVCVCARACVCVCMSIIIMCVYSGCRPTYYLVSVLLQ